MLFRLQRSKVHAMHRDALVFNSSLKGLRCWVCHVSLAPNGFKSAISRATLVAREHGGKRWPRELLCKCQSGGSGWVFDLNLTPLHRKNQRLNTANSLTWLSQRIVMLLDKMLFRLQRSKVHAMHRDALVFNSSLKGLRCWVCHVSLAPNGFKSAISRATLVAILGLCCPILHEECLLRKRRESIHCLRSSKANVACHTNQKLPEWFKVQMKSLPGRLHNVKAKSADWVRNVLSRRHPLKMRIDLQASEPAP